MAARGPVPKRSDQRIRRNLPKNPTDKITAIGTVPIPALNLGDDNLHPLVVDLYRSLTESAQARFYEPSDWQYARFCLHFANKLLLSPRPSAQLLVTVNQMLNALLVSEGDRRRVQLEVERHKATGVVVDVAELFRQRLGKSPVAPVGDP